MEQYFKHWNPFPAIRPKNFGYHLVTIDRDGITPVTIALWVGSYFIIENRSRDWKVIAWMELPMSYKKD